jgi:hypothetical protein
MKHITYAERDLFVGDDAADSLLEYAAAVSKAISADVVQLRAYDADGDEVEVRFLLNAGTMLLSESATAAVPEPDNADAVALLRERLIRLASVPSVQSADYVISYAYDDLGFDIGEAV